MQIALDAAKFSAEEANQLRKAMATFRDRGFRVIDYEARMVGRMVERGYDPAFASACFNQIKGFGQYGFPESHAASFAHLVYVSSWVKHHHPAAFCCALLNSQPMGFYAPAQIVRDAQEHGVEVLPVDVNWSDWDSSLEPQPVRPERSAERVVEGRWSTSYPCPQRHLPPLQASTCSRLTSLARSMPSSPGHSAAIRLSASRSNLPSARCAMAIVGGPSLRTSRVSARVSTPAMPMRSFAAIHSAKLWPDR